MNAIIPGFVPREGPHALQEINFRPLHAGHFITTLRGEQEQFDEWSKGPTDLVAGPPEPSQFIVAQDAIASVLLRWQLHARDRRDCNAVLFNGPIKQCAQPGQRPIGLNLGAPRNNAVN